MRVYAFLAAATGWSSLLIRYISGGNFHSLAQTANYLSYFSIISNGMAALVLTLAALQPPAQRHWLTRPFAATGITLYMTVSGLPFIILSLSNPAGWVMVSDPGLHYIMPIAFLAYWLFSISDGTLQPRQILAWLIFPFAYGVYSLVRGPLTGFYPYPFMQVGQVGLGRVLVSMAIMLFIFFALGGMLVTIDRGLGYCRLVASRARWSIAARIAGNVHQGLIRTRLRVEDLKFPPPAVVPDSQ